MIMKTFILVMLFLSTAIYAAPPLRLSVGAGEVIKNNNRFDNQYEKGQKDPIFITIPFINLNYGPLNIGGGGISLSLYGDRDRNAFLNLNRFGERYYGPSMDHRKDSLFFGGGFKWDQFTLVLNKDIGGNSKGLRTQLSYAYVKMFEDQSMLRLAFNLELLNQNFTNYYYGVKENEVTSSRPFYLPNKAIIPGISAFYNFKMMEKINWVNILTLKKWTNEIKKSPTTKGTDFETSLISAVTWAFY